MYYHSGWVQGYRADIVVLPRLSIGFSLMLNAETGLINELTTDFIDRVLVEYKGIRHSMKLVLIALCFMSFRCSWAAPDKISVISSC